MENNIKYLEIDLVQKLLSSIKDIKYKMIFTLIYDYGLRVSELLNLKLSDIDFKNKTIAILPLKYKVKTNKQLFPLLSESENLIKRYLKIRPVTSSSNLVVCKVYKGKTVVYDKQSRISIFQKFQSLCVKNGIDKQFAHPHTLRHSIAFAMAGNGVDIYTASQFLRHSSIKNTEVYYKINNQQRSDRFLQFHSKL